LISGDLEIIDDYFSWNVITPYWHLFCNGSWQKDSGPAIDHIYSSYESALEALERSREAIKMIPNRFPDYEFHLACAKLPLNCSEFESEHIIP